MKPTIKIVNATTGEEIEREMNAEEFARYEAKTQAYEELKADLAAKTEAKAAILERLGITEEEAKLLLS